MKTRILSLLLTIFCGNGVIAAEIDDSAHGQWVEWIADIGLQFQSSNNINFSAFADDSFTEQKVELSGSLGRYYQFNDTTRVAIFADVAISRFNRFNKQNGTLWAIGGVFRHKFGTGFARPFISIDSRYISDNYNASAWNNHQWLSQFTLGKHISEQLSGYIFANYNKMWSKGLPSIDTNISNQVFDQQHSKMGFGVDYLVSNSSLFQWQYQYRKGDFHSACTPENVAKALDSMQVEALGEDSIFGGCVYRLNGSAHKVNLSYSYAFSAHSAVNLAVDWINAQSGELSYHANLIGISYNYQY